MSSMNRRIWMLADLHIGHESDGRDGGDWFEVDVADVRDNLGGVDYVINLGDVSHSHQPEQLQRYADVRDASGLGPWFEVCGNHDFHATETGDYQRIIGEDRYWRLVDGNLLMLSLPAERGNAAALFLPEVEAWLREQVAEHPDHNIIICAHQFPCDTVERTERAARGMFPRTAVERFIEDVQRDTGGALRLWWGGHIHSGPRGDGHIARRDGVTFINAASASHSYGTGRCHGFILDMEARQRLARARCREHDTPRFVREHSAEVEFLHPIVLDDDGPTFTAFDLDVPGHYAKIDEEVVESF
jgi:hypothetical protein